MVVRQHQRQLVYAVDKMKRRVRSILAVSGVLLGLALVLWKKGRTAGNRRAAVYDNTHATEPPADLAVEDFTPVQKAVLRRVGEIWTEHGTSAG